MKKILTAAAMGAFAFASATPVFALDPAAETPAKTMQAPADATQKLPEPAMQKSTATEDSTSMEQTGSINRVTLVTGENSFTENQAKERIEGAGFANVSSLKLDEQGIWRGKADKGQAAMNVGLDFKGNVAAEPTTAE